MKMIRIVAVLALVGLVALLVFTAVDDYSLQRFARQYLDLSQRIAEHPVASGAIGVGIYTLLVVSLLPGVPLASVPFGLVYGWGAGTVVVLAGTAAGTSLLYFATRFLLPHSFGGMAGKAVEKLTAGISRSMISTMLSLRLMPPVPFTLLNVALPSLKVPFIPYLWTTLAGMAPRILVYAFAGEGLRALIDRQIAACAAAPDQTCQLDISASDFLTPEIIAATALLGVLAIVPVGVRWISERRARS